MLAIFVIGLTLYTGLSWFLFMDSTGRYTLNIINFLRNKLASFKDWTAGRRVKKDREQNYKQEQEIIEHRIPPKIEAVRHEIEIGIRAIKEKQENLFEPLSETILPPLNLLDEPPPKKTQYSKEALEAISRQVELKLKDFGVSVEVVAVHPGPVITLSLIHI